MDPRGPPPQTSSFPLAPIPPVRASDLDKSHHPKPASVYLCPPTEHQRTHTPPPFSVPAQTPSQPKSHKVTQFPALPLYDMTAGSKIAFELKNRIFWNKSSCRHPSVCYCCGASSNTLEVNISLKIIIILFLCNKIIFNI